MDIKYSEKEIKLNKTLNSLDIFTIDFAKILNELKIKYVIVSGYVSILFGRSRSSEDIDIIIENLEFTKFNELWSKLERKFECITTHDNKEAYSNYLLKKHAIRFSRKNQFIPNIELKFPKILLESLALKERKLTILNDNIIYISPIELQIAFKLLLGSEKDIEDAKHLYEVFKDNIKYNILSEFNKKLKTNNVFTKYIK